MAQRRSEMKQTWVALPTGAGLITLLGCLGNVVAETHEVSLAGKEGPIALSRLERILDGFAEREVVLVADACDAIESDACQNATQRSLAHRLKTANATAVYDIVTSPNALGHVVDLYVMVRLQYLVWIQEGQALRIFGEKGKEHASGALETASRDMSRIADLAMKPERRAMLDQKIADWRRQSPEARFVSMVRFGNLPDPSGKSPLEALNSLFDVLNPLDETSQTLEDAKRMAERVFYFSKRLPQLATWQAETALDETVANPEISRLLEGVSRTSMSIDRITKVLETVPQTVAGERKEILAAWDAREGKVNSAVKEVGRTVAETKDLAVKVAEAERAGQDLVVQANELAKSVGEVLREVAKMTESAKTSPSPAPTRPFNLSEYSAAAGEFTKLIREINTTLQEGRALLDSPAWVRRQEEVNRLTQQAVGHAGERGKEWVDHLMLRVVEAMLAFFALLLLYRITAVRLVRPRRGPVRQLDLSG
jgi:hypothetical protein